MMDASGLYPCGHHPILHDYLAHDLSQRAPVLSRQAGSVKYYYIDFGISSRFDGEVANKRVLGSKGLDKSAPELSDTTPYDPFKLDIYLLGNFFREVFTEVSMVLSHRPRRRKVNPRCNHRNTATYACWTRLWRR